MKKYKVRMSYTITVEASNEADAIHTAQYESLRSTDGEVKNLSQAVVGVIEPQPQETAPPDVAPERLASDEIGI